MKVYASIRVIRDDGTNLSREVSTQTERYWNGPNKAFQNETKAMMRKRFDRLLAQAVNGTMGRS